MKVKQEQPATFSKIYSNINWFILAGSLRRGNCSRILC